jgi:exonuclease SbcC
VSLANARAGRAKAEKELASAEARHQDAIRVQAQLLAMREQLEAARTKYAHGDVRAARIERELSQWNLLAKCLSNDGVIALDIDDAGPTFAALANDLLLASYGPRFTLQVCTQTATAKGELREDFDIIVHDGLRGESKSLKLVSGGERVWINECLTRAIALYLAGNTDRRYGTLFTDEADGALDPDRKRMFMQMKREVLRLGGYQREFFISMQWPSRPRKLQRDGRRPPAGRSCAPGSMPRRAPRHAGRFQHCTVRAGRMRRPHHVDRMR